MVFSVVFVLGVVMIESYLIKGTLTVAFSRRLVSSLPFLLSWYFAGLKPIQTIAELWNVG